MKPKLVKYSLAARARQAGLTLVELMIAMTIALFLLIALISLSISSSTTARELDKTSRQIESGRYAVQLLADDLSLAGYYGAFAPSGAVISTPDPCATLLANLGFNNATSPITIAAPVYGYVPGATPPSCLTNRVTGTGIIVVRRVSSVTTSVGALAAGETYLQVSGCSTDAQPFILDSNSANFTLHQKDCATLASPHKYMSRTYYVSSCDVCSGSNADTTPTLMVAEFIGGSITITPLAEGIQDLELDYGVDLDNNGSPDCYVKNPGIDNTAACPAWTSATNWNATIQNWGNVTAVRFHVLARNSETSIDWTDKRTYDMGLAGTDGPFNDAYKRHAFSAVARLVNVAGLRGQ